MNEHVCRHQRLLAVLAGLFGFAVTATLSAVPGSGVAEVIRAGTAAAAATAVNGRAQAAEAVAVRYAPDDHRRSGPSGGYAAIAGHGPAAPGPARTGARAGAAADGLPPSVPSSAVKVRGPPSSTGS
ncbi:hypothetical protein [Actinomadura macrotermitis]|uniref:Uncharacterized protein n=1 Tax=Actinomadura macrotermitis TaxID=2585200 RepID=A0A7K0BVD2_9ACTN|nr:hypothetical protein [Actinomadura macrotermitis]MQY05140.1 hypothetical protein [Actinomadura macrotermitis]